MTDISPPTLDMIDKEDRRFFRLGKSIIRLIEVFTGFDVSIIRRHLGVLLSTQSKLISQSVLIGMVTLLAFLSGGLVLSELIFHSDKTYAEIIYLLFNDNGKLNQLDYLYLFFSPILIILIGIAWAFIILNLYRLVIIITMNIGQHEGIRKYGRILFGILFSIICGFMLSIPLLRINFIEDISAYTQIQDREDLEDTLRRIDTNHHIAMRNAYINLYSAMPSDIPKDLINEYVPLEDMKNRDLVKDPDRELKVIEPNSNLQNNIENSPVNLKSIESLSNCSSKYIGKFLNGTVAFNKSDINSCLEELHLSISQIEQEIYDQKLNLSSFSMGLKGLQLQRERMQADQLVAIYHQLHVPGLIQSGIVVFKAVPLISWAFIAFIIFMMLSPILLKVFGPKSIYEYFVDEYNRIPLAEKGIELHRNDVIDRAGKEVGLIDRYYQYEEFQNKQKEEYLAQLSRQKNHQFEEFKDKFNRLRENLTSKD